MSSHVAFERAAEVIDDVVRRYVVGGSLDGADADDVRSTVTLRVLTRLADDAHNFDDVRNFDDFVAVMTHNAVRDVFRGRVPGRTRLRKRLLSILREDDRFVVLQEHGTSWCSLRAAAGRPKVERIELTSDDVATAGSKRSADAVAVLLERAGGPVPFDHLVAVVGGVWGMPLEDRSITTEAAEEQQALVDPAPDIAQQLVARETSLFLWKEICALPQRQRVALLLHLRDDQGSGAIPLLVFTGIATLDEIAEVLGLERAFIDELWDRLPLPDIEIASILETARPNVIGLRKAARERLARALSRVEGRRR